MFLFVLQKLLIEVLLEFFLFPVWWYTKGFLILMQWLKRRSLTLAQNLGIILWLKNLFTPMFGQYDISGRIISFFMRLFQLLFRSILFLAGNSVLVVLSLIWLLLPAFVFFQMVRVLAFA